MAKLEVLGHHTVYRNPHPNRVSEYVAFPAVRALPDDTLLCMCRHGTARESDDGVVKVHRSTDGGMSWEPTGALPDPANVPPGMRNPGGFGLPADGDVIAWAAYPAGGQGESGQLTWRSSDGGLTWSGPEQVDTAPYESIGVGGNLATLGDGTLVGASEWGNETSDEPDGIMPDWAALVSTSADNGMTWSPWRLAHGPRADGTYFFDLRICRLPDDRLLAVYWTHDMVRDVGLNVHLSWSSDRGQTWTDPHDGGFWGQVTSVAALRSGRVVAVTNHRRDPFGVRALLSDDDGARFDEADHLELWGLEPAQVRGAPVLARRRDLEQNLLESYHFFTFGTPSVTQLSDGVIVAAFYVTEEQVTYVRCCRLREADAGA